MSIGIRRLVQVSSLVLVTCAMPGLAVAQPDGLLSGNIKYNTGQSVQPIYEGWTKNADGTYQFFFGYLNRNHVQELSLPVGVGNQFAGSRRTSTPASTGRCSRSPFRLTGERRS
jgi:hypothetical protein